MLRIYPVRYLHEESIVRMCIEHIPKIAAEPELIRRAVHRPALLPHEEDRRARAILPAHHCIRPELLEVESAGIPVAGERLEPVVVILRAGVIHLLPVGVVTVRDEGRTIELERESRRRGVVEPRRHADRFLIESRERVMSSIGPAHTEVRSPLRIVDVAAVVQSDRCGKLRAELEARLRIDPPSVRIAFVTAVAAEPEVDVGLLAAVAFDSRPEVGAP